MSVGWSVCIRTAFAVAAVLLGASGSCLQTSPPEQEDSSSLRTNAARQTPAASDRPELEETGAAAEPAPDESASDSVDASLLRITIVYDNNDYDPKLKTAWGFSCVVECGDETVLFDTGGDSATLLGNMDKLGIDLSRLSAVVLSHRHGDHVGGLGGVLERNHNLSVYVGRSMPQAVKNRVTSAGAKLVEVTGPCGIAPAIFTTGELGTWIKEQSLVVRTERGLVVITGCAHPGVVSIAKAAQKQHDREVYLVVGGFHLAAASQVQIDSIVTSFKKLGVFKVAPCHCTGDRAIESFKRAYGDDFISAGVGSIIEVTDGSSAEHAV